MSNSSLVTHTNISPNKTSPRNHAIDTITIHCFVAQVTGARGCEVFLTNGCSSNYIVGFDGSVGMSVEEKDRSYCSSSASNDHRAITIEVASDNFAPYAVTDAAYNKLIELVTDICKRNGIKKLKWSTNKNERVNHLNGCNMTVHRDYANKSCPGAYLYERMGDIANKVNANLGTTTTPTKSITDIANEVIKGIWGNGVDRKNRLTKAGYDYSKVQSEVNRILTGKTSKPTPTKSITEIAKEVIRGEWGNGRDRKNRLTKAGYDYSKVQSEVNRLLS